ncbi:hypothetical protein ACDX38_29280, partial [Pseudomonas aeruginosa]|uniref:hypothetical protein n=1 Tax=Pseudomonas aeruginosa TaxID=287 RepID=UPI0039C2C5AA
AQGFHHRPRVGRVSFLSGGHPGDHVVHQRILFNLGGAPLAERQLSDERLGHSPAKRHYSVEISPKFLQNVETIPRKTCLCL